MAFKEGNRKPSVIHQSFCDEKVNGFRKQMGLEKIEIKKRKCLRCDKEFKSEGANNRMCDHCNYYAQVDQGQPWGDILPTNRFYS